jgi:hypothetical protein
VLNVGVAAGAEADHQVGVLRHHVQQRDRDLQHQVDFRIGLDEAAQPRHQDRARKGRRHRHLQLALALGQLPAREALQDRDALAHMGQVLAALGGEREVGAAEQLGADGLFQLPHPVADRAGCHAQFLRRLRHRAQAGQCFKGQQALDGRDAGHGNLSVIPAQAGIQTPVIPAQAGIQGIQEEALGPRPPPARGQALRG